MGKLSIPYGTMETMCLEQTAIHFCSECEMFLKFGKRTKCHSFCVLFMLCFYSLCWGLFECLAVSITGNQRCFTNKNNQDQSSVFSHKGKGEVTIFYCSNSLLPAKLFSALITPYT